jgi:hypothetical protein
MAGGDVVHRVDQRLRAIEALRVKTEFVAGGPADVGTVEKASGFTASGPASARRAC